MFFMYPYLYFTAGTHWMANLLHFLKTEGAVDSISTISPVLVELTPFDNWPRAEITNIISSHLLPIRMPREHVEKRGKIIVVSRDPRDAAVSMFHHVRNHRKLNCPNITWSHFIDCSLRGDGKVAFKFCFHFSVCYDLYILYLHLSSDSRMHSSNENTLCNFEIFELLKSLSCYKLALI